MYSKIYVVVVTFNRQRLLEKCLRALELQTQRPHEIIVVDNASSDGTQSFLASRKNSSPALLRTCRLEENLGGAGGFSAGLKLAISNGAEWVWMMDDDAEADPTALQELLRVAHDSSNIYGSVASDGHKLAWNATPARSPGTKISDIKLVPTELEVESIPFLGFFIHRDLVERIGVPDARYFIAADDVEYCLRAKLRGARLILAGRSHIRHPVADYSNVRVLGRNIVYLGLPPWKRYYDTRNRLLNARRYHGVKLFTNVLPGTFIRLLLTLWREPQKRAQLWAWCCGVFDGLLGISGRRHKKWRISH